MGYTAAPAAAPAGHGRTTYGHVANVTPDLGPSPARVQAFRLTDYAVSSVTGGSLWFCRRSAPVWWLDDDGHAAVDPHCTCSDCLITHEAQTRRPSRRKGVDHGHT
jgi:hypothetical protein